MTITLITGGNKGLGLETARRLVEDGHTVYITARDEQRGSAAAELIGAHFIQLDVTDDASVVHAAAEVERREGRIDVLINNAGIAAHGTPIPELTAQDAAPIFDTNYLGVIRVTHAFLPLLERSSSPVIINVSSGTGSFTLVNDPNRGESELRDPVYTASKAALNMLTVQYAKALPHMRVNVVDPGWTKTDINGNSGSQTIAEGTDAMVAMAKIGPDGPTGTYSDRYGQLGW
jgi:NAD(P)-dependent dehydrogenase (short-subunit alcohol dehydrogenase family)